MIRNGIFHALLSGVRRIDVLDGGILLSPLFGSPRQLPYVSLQTAVTTHTGLLGAALVVGDEVLVAGLSSGNAARLVRAYSSARLAFWRSRVVPGLARLREGIAVFAALRGDKRYFRTSDQQEWQRRLEQYVAELKYIPECGPLGLAVPEGAEDLKSFLSAPEEWRRSLNQRWMTAQEERFATFFDELEKHPLTPPQRRACVVDEDNVLVLAGAGTGKTSTMMAKAAYLVRAGLAKPEEILMLAFAKKAREELEARVHGLEGMEGVRVETFHSLGSKIIGTVEGTRRAVSALAQDDSKRTKFIDDGVMALEANEDFVAHLRNFFCSYLVPMPNELEFKTLGDYIRYFKNQEIRSLKGDVVKSFEELEIANYLFLNGIEYVYEGAYEHPTATPSCQQYKPDFYLPDLQVYVEHFGVNRDGDTAPDVPRQAYWDGIRWKRDTHREFGTALIETFSYEKQEGVLTDVLEQRLVAHCAEREIDFHTFKREQPFSVLKELGSYQVFAKLLDGFLTVFKGSTWTFGTLRAQLGSSWEDARLRVFLRIFEVVLARYEEALAESSTIDFNDMIKKASAYVLEGAFKSPYRYIMVDEFQDISPSRAALVKAMRDQVADSALFCVGDDWQAIYRFTGSDVTLTTKFSENFGPTERVDLDKTFRFNNRICDVASQFVQTNPGQLRKTIDTHTKSKGIEVTVINEGDHSSAIRQALDGVAARMAGKRASVFLLGRYKASKPRELAELGRAYHNLKLTFLTAHRSKGLEADYVIILDVIEGKKGFPSLMSTDPIIERILPSAEEFKHAEERRLFYVALTRARHSVWVLTQPGRESPFINELSQGGYEVNFNREALKSYAATTTPCPACLEGVLARRQGRNGFFYGCSLYPYCEGTAKPCPSCGQAPLTTNGEVHCCAHPDCGFEAKTCPACGVGYMRLNEKGPYGPFYGCSNWRGSGPESCRHKEKVKAQKEVNGVRVD